MAETSGRSWRSMLADKKALQQVMAEVNAETGFVPDPTATPQKAQEMMIALGIRAEDNIFSCGIIAARDEE